MQRLSASGIRGGSIEETKPISIPPYVISAATTAVSRLVPFGNVRSGSRFPNEVRAQFRGWELGVDCRLVKQLISIA
jgi:hypothetical protein